MFDCPNCNSEIFIGRNSCSNCKASLLNADIDFKKQTLRATRYKNMEYFIFLLGALIALVACFYLRPSHDYFKSIIFIDVGLVMLLHSIHSAVTGISTTRSIIEPYVQFNSKPISFLVYLFIALFLTVIFIYEGIGLIP